MDSNKINLEREKKCLFVTNATEKERGRDKLNVKKRKNGIRENETDKKKCGMQTEIHKKWKKKNMHRKIKSKYLCTIWNCVCGDGRDDDDDDGGFCMILRMVNRITWIFCNIDC